MHEHAYSKRQMGTDVALSFVTSEKADADIAAREAFTVIDEYEQCFSRFIETSELSRLNTERNMVVSERFFDVLMAAYELYTQTHGVFNPLVQVSRYGYNRDFAALSHGTAVEDSGPYNLDLSRIRIDPTTRRVRLAAGQVLDFNGFLKGYLAEKLARSLAKAHPTFHGIIVNIGGDLHTRGLDARGMPFEFLLYNPVTDTEEAVPMTNKSLATSGTYTRVWQTADGPVHHILGPDGMPNPDTHTVSASIIHEHGDVAEAYAKLFLLLGEEHASFLIPAHNYAYHLIADDGSVRSTII